MAKNSTLGHKRPFKGVTTGHRWLLCGGAVLSALLLAACTVEVQNTQAAEEVARLSRPPGSVYVGWRVFQDRCAGCHGSTATGTSGAPDLLPRVRQMGARQFVSLVLKRYDWNASTAKTSGDGAAREAVIDDILQRNEKFMLTMPAWQNEPAVSVHIADLFAYLSARALGTQGPERPVP